MDWKALGSLALKWTAARLRESSTYAGLGLLIITLFHPTQSLDPLMHALTDLGTGIGGLLAIVIAEKQL